VASFGPETSGVEAGDAYFMDRWADRLGLGVATWGALCCGYIPAEAAIGGPPEGFVRLADIAPAIAQDMRYAGAENFIGRPVPGYGAPQCWLRREVAAALAAAAEEAAREGLRLVVYDCYRPQRATDAFVRWAADPCDQQMKRAYYPDVDKRALFERGYIAKISTHSRGIAVDLAFEGKDFGTPFDLFDAKSATHHPEITGETKANRIRLEALMHKHGFENLPNEWWHFSFKALKDAPLVDVEIK
jgi:D-alanyl-D-alanine dipeptidase